MSDPTSQIPSPGIAAARGVGGVVDAVGGCAVAVTVTWTVLVAVGREAFAFGGAVLVSTEDAGAVTVT